MAQKPRVVPSPPAPIAVNPRLVPAPCTRRFSLAFFAALPIVDAIGNEAQLWKQEVDLYKRRGGEAVSNALAGVLPSSKPTAPRTRLGRSSIDAEFASALLTSIFIAAGSKAASVKTDADFLAAQELPLFQNAGTCGHCGTTSGPSALKDRDYFDFLAYSRGKSLLKNFSGGDESDIDYLRLEIGEAILDHILSEIDVGEAEAVGISPFRAFATTSVALLSASPELDSIRGGVRALLNYFQRKGRYGGFYC